ncbi:MAG TPA: peptidase S41 [Bacteroidales bacterium]|jgi:carboxyl-terminal processing protease|nr:peptidase S41 [Bacteroidales bacterium]
MNKFKSILGKKGKILIISLSLVILSLGVFSFKNPAFEITRNLDIFISLFREVHTLYVDGAEPEELINSSIEGMLESLDPYTTYIPAEDVDDFKFMTTGKYGGIGALIRKAGEYTIISEPYEGFPAQENDLRAGDTLVSINGVNTKGKSISEVSQLLKGTPNTEVVLKLKRIGEESLITKTFKREQVSIPNVPYYGLLDNYVGYIILGNFMKNAGKDVKDAYLDLIDKGATSVILDLRSNPGGLLAEAVNVANLWVPKNQEIVSTRGKVQQWDKTYKTKYNPVDTTMPVVVLVNRASASASEIVAGALQDLDRAVVIGQKTFGKGLVQTTRPLSYDAHLKITTAKYYIPSGRCIQALDYAHRNEDGSVGYIPDSLISEFKTNNGRSVFDGGGIEPDIKIQSDGPGNITVAAFTQNHIFNFATEFASKNPSIAEANLFEISDEIYSDFKTYLADKEFDYNTESSEQLKELINTTKLEGYYEKIENELNALEEHLHGDLEKDLNTFKPEIKELLRDEIVSRYYFQKGRIIAGIHDDPEIIKAVEILNDNEAMLSILNGSYDGETIFAFNYY